MASDCIGEGIEVRGLRKSFDGLSALKGIDFDVAPGEALAVFGPNGAGKTTLVRILSTLSRPTRGRVNLDGLDIVKKATEVRRRIGVVSHQTFLYENLTARENLIFYGRMYAVTDLGRRIDEVIDQVGLAHRLHDRVATFSRGMQQRLSIARAMLHQPTVMLLDEPETGLDQQATRVLGGLLKDLTGGGRTVLMTTHRLELGLDLADRWLILNRGRIAAEGRTQGMSLTDLEQVYHRETGAVR